MHRHLVDLPRHLHRYPYPTSIIVRTPEALDAALAEGWSLTPQLEPAVEPEPIVAPVTVVMASVEAVESPIPALAPIPKSRKRR